MAKAKAASYKTVSCGHTKTEAKAKAKKLRESGYGARLKKGEAGKGWCLQKGKKLKSKK